MKKLLSILLLIPSLAFGASAGGGAGSNITSESQHPLRHKSNRIVTEAYGANSGVTVEAQLHNIIDGIGISPGTYVPYTGAISAVDLNSQSLTTTGTLSAGATTINTNSTTALLVEQDGVKDNTFVVDTTNVRIGINKIPSVLLDASVTAIASTREKLAEFRVSDDAVSLIGIGNATSSNNRFSPTFLGVSNNAADGGLNFTAAFASGVDTGSIGALTFNARTYTGDYLNGSFSSLITRPLAAFYNNGTIEFFILSGGGVVVNESSNDSDSRFEGNNDPNLLFLDAGVDQVGIGTSDFDGTPATGKFVVKGSTNDGSTNVFVGRDSGGANVATLDTNGNAVLSGTLAVNGDSITSDGDLTLDPAGSDLLLDATGPNYAADGGANDDYAITLTGITIKTGMVIYFKANTANTGACTLNINGVGAVSLKSFHDQDPPDNYIEAGSMVQVIYDGTNYQILSPDANP